MIQRVVKRRIGQLRHRVTRMLHLDSTYLMLPTTAMSVFTFRTASMFHRSAPALDAPPDVQPLASGSSADLHVEGLFPRA
eukprot:2945661-Prymnesium_polylepis.1